MKMERFVAMAVAFSLATAPGALLAQQSTTLAGTAKDEVKSNRPDFTVRARDVAAGAIAGTTNLDAQGNFALPGLSGANYLIELVNKNGKVVCTEGPFNMAQQAIKDNVVIDCDKKPTALLLLAAAAAAGVTAGVVANGDDPAPAAGPTVNAVNSLSASR